MKFFKGLEFSGILLFTLNLVCCVERPSDHHNSAPEQVHISFGDSLSDIVVTWVTRNKTKKSMVYYGYDGLNKKVEGKQIVFEKGEDQFIYIHRATLRNLKEDIKYEYKCGSPLGWSKIFIFRTPKISSNWSPKLAIYGDMGLKNARSLEYLKKESQEGKYDAILHVGDFAYDLNSYSGSTGDKFMKMIEPIAARVPYMTAVGNHEESQNFTHYKNRFSMPGETEGLYYSFDMGPVHFVVFSTEAYYFLDKYGTIVAQNQYNWLINDLKKATEKEKRQKTPWIITVGHRPMYCSDNDHDDCTYSYDSIRIGITEKHLYALEKLFYDYGVDIEIYAHEHSYERTWPLYNYKVYNGSKDNPYENPKAPVHIISGSAVGFGCSEYVDHFKKENATWSAFRSSEYGYTIMTVHNASHIHFQQVSVNKKPKFIDDFWIVKNFHGAYVDVTTPDKNVDENPFVEQVRK